MNIIDFVKKILPLPILPQKRYIILVSGVIAWAVLKGYVMLTPSTADDHLPDEVKSMLFNYLLADNEQDGVESN